MKQQKQKQGRVKVEKFGAVYGGFSRIPMGLMQMYADNLRQEISPLSLISPAYSGSSSAVDEELMSFPPSGNFVTHLTSWLCYELTGC